MRAYQSVISSAFVLLALLFNLAARADTIPGTICTEDALNGCNQNIIITLADGTIMTMRVASDGESHPFVPVWGIGAPDTSDGIKFEFNGPTNVMNQSPEGWIAAPGIVNAWILPADLTGIGCGKENETTCEPLGSFLLNKKLEAGF